MAYVPLSLLEREEIRVALTEDLVVSCAAIGRRIGRHPTTIGRELARNGGRDRYRAATADARAVRARSRRRAALLVTDPMLRATVTAVLTVGFSPAAVAARLRDHTARVIMRGHALMQNIRRRHYELGVDARDHRRVDHAFTELARTI